MRVTVYQNSKVVTHVDYPNGVLTIGRSTKNTLRLTHTDVSREHAKIVKENDHFILEDLQSHNGTFFKEQKIQRMRIEPGDVFFIGPYELRLEDSEERQTAKILETSDGFMEAISVSPPPDTFARLIRLDGEDKGKEIILEKNETKLGTDKSNEVVIKGEDIAHTHAKIERNEHTFILKDQDESTGTFVDGVPIRNRELESHDVVEMGDARFEFLQGNARSRIEPPRVIEKPKRKSTDWRILVLGGLLLGLFSVLIISSQKETPSSSKSKILKKAKKDESEYQRVLLHHITKAKELIRKNKLNEAEQKIQLILDSLAPNHPQAMKLLAEIKQKRTHAKRKEEENRQKELKTKKKIASLMAQGDALAKSKKFSSAREKYKEVLKLEPKRKDALSALEELAGLEEQEHRIAVSKKKKAEELGKIYKEGIQRYEAGEYGEAEKLLSAVASSRDSPHRASAKRLLKEIKEQTDEKLNERIEDIQSLIESNRLIQAYEELSLLVRQFPKQKSAALIFENLKKKMGIRAKTAYAEGIAQLELAEDPAAALDKFEEALKYSPDPESEYHRKAKTKIEALELSP